MYNNFIVIGNCKGLSALAMRYKNLLKVYLSVLFTTKRRAPASRGWSLAMGLQHNMSAYVIVKSRTGLMYFSIISGRNKH